MHASSPSVCGRARRASRVQAAPEWGRLREAVRLETKLLGDEVRVKQRLKSLYRRRGVACVNGEVYSPRLRGEWNAKLPPSLRPSSELLGQELDQLLELQHTAEQQMCDAAPEVSDVAQAPDGSGDRSEASRAATGDRRDASSFPYQATLLVLLWTGSGDALDLGLGPAEQRQDGAGSGAPDPRPEQGEQTTR